MLYFSKVLSESVLEKVFNEFNSKVDQPVWKPSSFFWPVGIRKNVYHDILVNLCSDELNSAIKENLTPTAKALSIDFDSLSKFTSMFYIWQKGSAISNHNDYSYKFGATIYLNENWDIDDGGIFLWRRKTDNPSAWHAVVPTFNFMVVNNESEDHLVTPVNVNAEQRVTIQIFAS